MKLFTFLAISAVAIHSCAGTFSLPSPKKFNTGTSLVRKVFKADGGVVQAESYDIHIKREPVCADCVNKHPSAPVFPVKGRYYYYPTSYFYPSTAYYYYPSYAVPVVSGQHAHSAHATQAQSAHVQPQAQRRYDYYGAGSTYSQAHYVYPSVHKDVKPYHVPEYYPAAGYVPAYYYPPGYPQVHGQGGPIPVTAQSAPVPVAYYPPFSKLVRHKSGRPLVSPAHAHHDGFKGTPGSSHGGTKGGTTTTTTEAPDEQQQQQEEIPEEQAPVKGGYYYRPSGPSVV